MHAAIASALRVQEVPNRPLLETLLAYLKNKTLLLILDNCEHVITQAATVAVHVAGGLPAHSNPCDQPRTAARRGRTYLPATVVEHAIARGRCSAARNGCRANMERSSSLRDRARAVDHRFALTDENAPAVAELCRRLDGIPLAIELAAARVNALSITALVERLEDRFRILAGGERTALPRQQTMRATIDWSYNLLSAPEQRVFERLSIFPGDFSLESASAVGNDDTIDEVAVLDLLFSLVDKSLVQAEFVGNWTRYRLLESTRQYARERLTEHGDYTAVARAHAAAFLALAEELEGPATEVWFAKVEPEIENWRAALQWALSGGDVALGQSLVGALRPMWSFFGAAETRRWIRVAIEKIDARTPDAVIASLDISEAQLDASLHQHKASYDAAERALERYRRLDDVHGITQAQARAGRALVFLGRVAEGEGSATRSAFGPSSDLIFEKGWPAL